MNICQNFSVKNCDFCIVQNFQLSAQELEDFKNLVHDCEVFDKKKPKIYWEFLQIKRKYPANFLVYLKHDNEQMLVGYFSYFLFEHDQTELLAFVHPQYRRLGIFDHVFQILSKILKNFGIKHYFFVIPDTNQMAKQCAKMLGGTFSYYEYHMERMITTHENIPDNDLVIRQANQHDISCIATIEQSCFHTHYDVAVQRFKEILTYPNREIWVCYDNDICLGNAHITFEDTTASVHNIGVLPEYRNLGYATVLLKTVINHLISTNKVNKVALDVSSENSNALSIYKKCGFSVTDIYEYWKIID